MTKAFMIHKRPVGDTSAYISFLCEEEGFISVTCKGARIPKKQALLQSFTPLWLNLDRNLRYLQKVETLSSQIPLVTDALFSGLYINELIYYAFYPGGETHTEHDAGNFFQYYKDTLIGLSNATDRINIAKILRKFEIYLLTIIGYSPDFTRDVSGNKILSDKIYTLVSGDGFIALDNNQSSRKFTISGDYIIAIREEDYKDEHVLSHAKIILRLALDNALADKTIKSRCLYKKAITTIN